jgi:hypothetical protein
MLEVQRTFVGYAYTFLFRGLLRMCARSVQGRCRGVEVQRFGSGELWRTFENVYTPGVRRRRRARAPPQAPPRAGRANMRTLAPELPRTTCVATTGVPGHTCPSHSFPQPHAHCREPRQVGCNRRKPPPLPGMQASSSRCPERAQVGCDTPPSAPLLLLPPRLVKESDRQGHIHQNMSPAQNQPALSYYSLLLFSLIILSYYSLLLFSLIILSYYSLLLFSLIILSYYSLCGQRCWPLPAARAPPRLVSGGTLSREGCLRRDRVGEGAPADA